MTLKHNIININIKKKIARLTKLNVHVFFISNSTLGVNVRFSWQIYDFKVKSSTAVALKFPIVKMAVSYYITYTNHFDRPGKKAVICKINHFFIVTSICPKY